MSFSSSPFGAPAPAPTPAPAPAPVTDPVAEQDPRRSRLVLAGAGTGLLLLGGAALLLLTDPAEPVAAPVLPPVTATPPEATPPVVGLPLQPLAARNPFVPLVTEPEEAVSADTAGGSGTTSGGLTASEPYGALTTARSGSSSGGGTAGITPSGTGSTSTGSTEPAPTVNPSPAPPSGGNPTAVVLNADQTCTAADDIWGRYLSTMEDATLTETMAGHVIGGYVAAINELAESTSATALRQPLSAWALETGEVRALLVTQKAWRPAMVPDSMPPPVSGQPTDDSVPVVDQADVITARTAQRERCFQLIDPFVTPEEM